MSRNIAPKPSVSLTENEMDLRKTDKNRLLLTSYHGKNCALLIQDDRLMEAAFFSREPGKVGAVYIGRVKNVAQNINACFIDIGEGEICFLPLKNAISPWLLNRCPDGRLLEGDELLVQVVRDAQKGKRASVTAHISLANEYFVLTMGESKVGYSARRKKSSCKKTVSGKGPVRPERKRLSETELRLFTVRNRLPSQKGSGNPAGVPGPSSDGPYCQDQGGRNSAYGRVTAVFLYAVSTIH